MSLDPSIGHDMYAKQRLIVDQLNVSIFAKDVHGKYIFSNDSFASAAGVDSKEKIVGLSDRDLYWRRQADIFIAGDLSTLDGYSFINVPEILLQPQGTRKVCTTKSILRSNAGKPIGIVGSFFDITEFALFKCPIRFMERTNKLYLGPSYSNQYLTYQETRVLFFLLLGCSAQKVSKNLSLSPNTIQFHIKNLKCKMQCSSKGELIERAVISGISFALFDRFLKRDVGSKKMDSNEIESMTKSSGYELYGTKPRASGSEGDSI